MKVTSSHPAWM